MSFESIITDFFRFFCPLDGSPGIFENAPFLVGTLQGEPQLALRGYGTQRRSGFSTHRLEHDTHS